jgi:hypothetical protein
MRRSWVHSRWFAVIAGVVMGGAAGLAVYQGSRLSGQALFVLCGTTAGAVAAVVFSGYARTVRLTEMTVSVPQFSELRFAVTPTNELVAWRLFVESVTRISVQPLDADSGIVREALSSLYALFQTVRQVLTETQPSRRTGGKPTIEHLAIAMLNNEMRPFMAKWHARLSRWEKTNPGVGEQEWPENSQCRAELEDLRLRMLTYVAGYGELARVPNVQDIMQGSVESLAVSMPIRQSARVVGPHAASADGERR